MQIRCEFKQFLVFKLYKVKLFEIVELAGHYLVSVKSFRLARIANLELNLDRTRIYILEISLGSLTTEGSIYCLKAELVI